MFSCQGAIHGKGFYKQHQRPDCNAIQGLPSMRLEYTVLCTVYCGGSVHVSTFRALSRRCIT